MRVRRIATAPNTVPTRPASSETNSPLASLSEAVGARIYVRFDAPVPATLSSRENSGPSTAALGPAFERHYRIGELAELWNFGRETVRVLVKDEDGVLKLRLGPTKAHAIYSVPESVARRIHTRLQNSR